MEEVRGDEKMAQKAKQGYLLRMRVIGYRSAQGIMALLNVGNVREKSGSRRPCCHVVSMVFVRMKRVRYPAMMLAQPVYDITLFVEGKDESDCLRWQEYFSSYKPRRI